jgi:hypothetical protein
MSKQRETWEWEEDIRTATFPPGKREEKKKEKKKRNGFSTRR